MKTLRRVARLAIRGSILAWCVSEAGAQSYFSLQNTNWPPLPCPPLNLPVYPLGDGAYAYDDRSVDYAQREAEAALLAAVELALRPALPRNYG